MGFFGGSLARHPSWVPDSRGQAQGLPLPAAAYQVYHFQSVTRMDGRRIPAGSGHDLKILLDRHSVSRQFQPLNQCRQGHTFRYLARFTIQLHGHDPLLPTVNRSPCIDGRKYTLVRTYGNEWTHFQARRNVQVVSNPTVTSWIEDGRLRAKPRPRRKAN